jgi:hypothetical protein
MPVSAELMVAAVDAVEAFPAKLGHVRVFVLGLYTKLDDVY